MKNSAGKKFSINAKVFRQDAVRAVLDLGKQVATVDSGGLEDGLMKRAVGKRGNREVDNGA